MRLKILERFSVALGKTQDRNNIAVSYMEGQLRKKPEDRKPYFRGREKINLAHDLFLVFEWDQLIRNKIYVVEFLRLVGFLSRNKNEYYAITEILRKSK